MRADREQRTQPASASWSLLPENLAPLMLNGGRLGRL
jgi:hypothetical protein